MQIETNIIPSINTTGAISGVGLLTFPKHLSSPPVSYWKNLCLIKSKIKTYGWFEKIIVS